jgi:dihydrodipicolinate synthase/N-acetylneuraminate lyase
MLQAIVSHDYDRAEEIRRIFLPLESLRNEINPIRVLHEAVTLAGIADTGRQLPLLSGLAHSAIERIRPVAAALLHAS